MRAALIAVPAVSGAVLRGVDAGNSSVPMASTDFAPIYKFMIKNENRDCPFFEDSIKMVQQHAKETRGAELTTKQVDECLVKCGYPGGVMHMFGERMVKYPFQCCPDSCYRDEQVTLDKCAATC
mmetsp:Transcript_34864/g.84228  ORF Transcript_34864/g.84228 Transcript_34864/m.84228 type:complete len:124 (-) Transcript_34864:76-447(-)